MSQKQIKYQNKVNELDLSRLELYQNEQIVHCIDAVMYVPEYLITSLGRVWSLSHSKWLKPQFKNNYWTLNPKNPQGKTRKITVHQLVAHYFMDKSDRIAIDEWGYAGTEVHHIFKIDIEKAKYIFEHGTDKEVIESCMRDSCKYNLAYQERQVDHKADTNMSHGLPTANEQTSIDEWDATLANQRQSMYQIGQLDSNKYGTYYQYSRDEQGKVKKKLKLRLNIDYANGMRIMAVDEENTFKMAQLTDKELNELKDYAVAIYREVNSNIDTFDEVFNAELEWQGIRFIAIA